MRVVAPFSACLPHLFLSVRSWSHSKAGCSAIPGSDVFNVEKGTHRSFGWKLFLHVMEFGMAVDATTTASLKVVVMVNRSEFLFDRAEGYSTLTLEEQLSEQSLPIPG
eukprot:RCo004295